MGEKKVVEKEGIHKLAHDADEISCEIQCKWLYSKNTHAMEENEEKTKEKLAKQVPNVCHAFRYNFNHKRCILMNCGKTPIKRTGSWKQEAGAISKYFVKEEPKKKPKKEPKEELKEELKEEPESVPEPELEPELEP